MYGRIHNMNDGQLIAGGLLAIILAVYLHTSTGQDLPDARHGENWQHASTVLELKQKFLLGRNAGLDSASDFASGPEYRSDHGSDFRNRLHRYWLRKAGAEHLLKYHSG